MARSVLVDFMAATSAVVKGDMTGANNAMRRAITAIDWSSRRPVHGHLGWSVYTHQGMSYGAVYVESAAQRIIVAPGTWETLQCHGPAMLQFLQDMTSGANGMKFVTMDSGAYVDAARAEAERTKADVVQGKDAVTDLGERVGALIAQASSMQGTEATDLQLHAFLQRLADCQRDFEDLHERMDKLGESVAIAARLVAAL